MDRLMAAAILLVAVPFGCLLGGFLLNFWLVGKDGWERLKVWSPLLPFALYCLGVWLVDKLLIR